jgi:outer membrane protein TolC
MRRLLLLWCLLFSNTIAQENELTLNLDQVVELALKQNLDFRMSAEKLARLRTAEKEARSQKWATLDFESAYSHISDVMEINIPAPTIPGLPIQIPSQSIQFGDGNELEFFLQFSQPLYTGGALIANSKAAAQEVLGQKWQVKVQKTNLEFKARKSFFSLAKALEFKKVTQSSIEQIQAHLNDVNQFYQQGQVTRNEVLTVEVKLSQAELLLAQAEKNIEFARLALALLLDLELTQKINISYDPLAWESAFSGQSPLQLDQKPEIIAFRHQMEGLRFRRDALRGSRRPGLGLFGRYVYAKPGLNKVANEWMDYWMMGVSLKWNLWDWGRKPAQIQQIQQHLNEMQLGFQQLQHALAADVEQTRLNLADVVQQLKISRKMQKQAEENFRIVSNRFDQGLETNSAFLDAQTELTRCQLQLVQQQIDWQIALADYQRAISGDAEN